MVAYDEKTVVRALDGLKEKQLVWQSDADRVPKYAHSLDKRLNMVRREAAVVCLLLLRGPQTAGELRGRSERLYDFASLEEVLETLQALEEVGAAMKLERQPGRKESRYAHLLSGEPLQLDSPAMAVPESATLEVREEGERIAALAHEVEGLRENLEDLREEFRQFIKQFE